MIEFSWLAQDVPLWALLVAMLTSPALWSAYVKDAVADLYAEYSPVDNDK